ncbi:hypothetical protein JTE90_013647 [Oedothorax gibbosus]|uniref:Uncharacterized protein n=1 Tax=Oedothorax gibbosus TaxID=931172 RepID=A0AAV6TTV3_9ARAC|nr:hypothetical protein JTE90_013647 [Oedothorax gibbosus]
MNTKNLRTQLYNASVLPYSHEPCEVLEEKYDSNAVLHMMTGKAISRAIRGHLLVDAALSTLLMADVFPCNEDGSCHKIIQDASVLYDSIMSDNESGANVEF